MGLALAISLVLAAQAPKGGHPDVDQDKVDKAVTAGAEYLLREAGGGSDAINHPHGGAMSTDELVLYTLIHAGTDPETPLFQKLLDSVLTNELNRTYPVALTAMALEALDKQKHQFRIAQCAQFLVDNQCANGQWDYGEAVPLPKKDPPKKDVVTPGGSPGGGGAKASGGTTAIPKIPIKRRQKGRNAGDNSNAQYAALGLRACLNASIELPTDTLVQGLKWWEKSQNADGGWSYDYMGQRGGPSYGSMTAGAVGACVIYRHYLKADYRKDPVVRSGLKWLGQEFTAKENPKHQPPQGWLYYWLYAVERVGLLFGGEQLGKHAWYPEGCDFLFGAQAADGSWVSALRTPGGATTDTCFAILFLRRATKPLPRVETGK